MRIHRKHYYIAGGIITAIIIFFGGMMLGKNQGGQTMPEGQQRGTIGGGFTSKNSQSGNTISGQIVSVDSEGMTIQTRDGSTRIVLVPSSASITVVKPQSASMSDLKAGEEVTVNGASNSDGSITAQSIQIRQANSVPK